MYCESKTVYNQSNDDYQQKYNVFVFQCSSIRRKFVCNLFELEVNKSFGLQYEITYLYRTYFTSKRAVRYRLDCLITNRLNFFKTPNMMMYKLNISKKYICLYTSVFIISVESL